MSKAVSALGGASHKGFAEVAEAGLRGMITVRGDLSSAAMKKAVKAAAGTAVPAARRIEIAGDKATAWMSPDELLVMVPYEAAQDTVAALEKALAGEHHLVADVSDARSVFTIQGAKAPEVLMKLCPVDFGTLAEGEIRRTRAAQVAAAFWKSGAEEFTLVSFRSVAGYVMGLLEVSSRAGGEIFPA
ncbi:sarcosine oxidase subunit gamma [Albidovulum sediminicola]|uniref:Sarcosine oxidase subunit gamma n=1 Tax=Albidovulum sediminicola TaxID=2984331 RepID=A0ABT2Z5V6_9RHOB|nr:sarcosine oxidase subunit gamma family protein [Defluviimonas sp. WL0075]MCV2866535.1 sarcosine oxidase subunit gamma [Defluviimonas sp. WL0075]